MKTFNNSSSHFINCVAIALCLIYSGFAYSAPSAPTNLTGNLTSDTVVLEWDAVADVAGYNVYVNNGYLTTTLTNSYTGSIDADQVYNFYVTAFTNEPTEFSPRSDQLTLPESAVPDDLTIPPSVPAGLAGNITGTTVSLSWEPSTDDEAVSGYNIYQNNQYLTTVFDTQFEGSVVAGQSYAYSVVAFDTRVNFSAASDRLTLPDTGPVDTTIPPSTPDGIAGDITGLRRTAHRSD